MRDRDAVISDTIGRYSARGVKPTFLVVMVPGRWVHLALAWCGRPATIAALSARPAAAILPSR
jgi:hypothetical protein